MKKQQVIVIVCIIAIVLAVAALAWHFMGSKGGAVDKETGEDLTQPLQLDPNATLPPLDPNSAGAAPK